MTDKELFEEIFVPCLSVLDDANRLEGTPLEWFFKAPKPLTKEEEQRRDEERQRKEKVAYIKPWITHLKYNCDKGVCESCGFVGNKALFRNGSLSECKECRKEWMKQHRKKKKEQGICIRCLKNEAGEGRTICLSCQEENNKRRDEYRKEKRRCYTCCKIKTADDPGVNCRKCQDDINRQHKEKRSDLTVCSECFNKLGEFDVLAGRRNCPQCNERKRISKEKCSEKQKGSSI